MIDGRLTFIVDPNSRSKPSSCLTTIIVSAKDPERRVEAGPGDNLGLVDAGIVWWNSVGHDCETRFPVAYGVPLAGGPRTPEEVEREVAAKELTLGVVYEVVANAGIGYGGGRFRLTADGGVENLPRGDLADVR
ncbi:hypothetical protein [Brevundimonas sp.]|uniref:hypothetical protein n=1 Tax=Brevundimonas sp. TaxID=1871086 RepID=UPI00356242EC